MTQSKSDMKRRNILEGKDIAKGLKQSQPREFWIGWPDGETPEVLPETNNGRPPAGAIRVVDTFAVCELKSEVAELKTRLYDTEHDYRLLLANRNDLEIKCGDLEAKLAHRHIIGKAYEVSAASINRLAGELDETRTLNRLVTEANRILRGALKDWLDWEADQIRKEGPYVGKRINELIKQGKQALADADKMRGGE